MFKAQKLPNPITRFAKSGLAALTFPSSHAMSRWEVELQIGIKYQHQVILVGRLGDVVDFSTLDASVQTDGVAKKVGAAKADYHPIGFEACGSRGEQGNDPSLGNRFTWMEFQMRQSKDFPGEVWSC